MVKDLLRTMLDVPVLRARRAGRATTSSARSRARARPRATTCCLVTGDRDMYQLVTEHVNVVSTRKGVSDVARS